MKRRFARRIEAAGIALLSACWSTTSLGLEVNIDRFTVTRDASVLFDDTFGDGTPPPSAPNFVTGLAASYNVVGTIPAGAESAGLLHLDSVNGAVTANAADAARRGVFATLLTSTTGGATQLGIGNVLQLSGTFGLAIPPGPLYSGYGIRFTDAAGAGNHQLAQLSVQYGEAFAQPRISYLIQDFDADTVTTLANVALTPPGGADQIRLMLTRPNAANNEFLGSFAFLSGGLVVGGGAFDVPAVLFQGESFVRAQFFVAEAIATPVPEPEIFLLMGVGAAFAFVARRRAVRVRR